MLKSRFLQTDVEVLQPTVEHPDPDHMLTELFSIIRRAIVDTGGGLLCAATLVDSTDEIHLSTPRPLSAADLTLIREAMSQSLDPEATPEDALDFQMIINGQSERQVLLEASDHLVAQHQAVPIAIRKTPVGILFAGSFDARLDRRHARLLKHFSRDAIRALRHLWRLNALQRERLEALVTHSIDGIILCDWRKRVLYLNHMARRLLGIDSQQGLLGKTLNHLNVGFLAEYLDEAQQNGIFESNKVASLSEKHSKYLGVHVELLRNTANREIGWMVVLRDVTKNWQRDQMRSSLSAASHEINAPLTSMQGAVDLLLDRDLGDLNGEQEHCLQVLKDDITRLRRLLRDLLDLSKFDEGIQFLDRRKEVKLDFVVQKVIDSLRGFADSRNITVTSLVPRSLPTFKGDRDRLQQVLVNLVENGIKFGLPGGEVTIDAELEKTTLKVWVKDTGVGIPANEFERIFERFYQLDNDPGSGPRGYGLGLSIAKQIVESFGGEIWVESEEGVGSTFYFTILV